MTGLFYWNDWTNGLYYLTERGGSNLYTIQILLNKINENLTFLSQNASSAAGVNAGELPATTVRMAIAIVGVLPIMIIYPFFQKYFVKGIMLGGVKG
jgi:putative aldouronate transport system permease protein